MNTRSRRGSRRCAVEAVPAIDSVTAPLVVRHPDGHEHLVAACFTHPLGLLYLDLYWHRSTPRDAAHLVHGEITGEGPWRIGDVRVRVLGCQHTDPHLQASFIAWQQHLQEPDTAYPPRAQIVEIARRLGATPR